MHNQQGGIVEANEFRSRINGDWQFQIIETSGSLNASAWQKVTLPHSPSIWNTHGHQHWAGRCRYRKTLQMAKPPAVGEPQGQYAAIYIEAAMQHAWVYVDGELLVENRGGYLPFEVDLDDRLVDGEPHLLEIELDNRHNREIPPGKPFDELDFCCYGGMYRNVELRSYRGVRITDPVAANEVAGGGVFLRTLGISNGTARVSAKVHLQNMQPTATCSVLHLHMKNPQGAVVFENAETVEMHAHQVLSHLIEFEVEAAQLWHPEYPNLNEITVTVAAGDGTKLDEHREQFGLRTIHFSRSEGFVINGQSFRARGTNRHQDYPWLGYAIPDAVQFQDALHIKEAGFDYVRLSHYPQSPAFYRACDQLGILVMNCLPGWQFFGNEVFQEASYEQARKLIRRDRNHACVVLWELSLNETEMDQEFISRLHEIGHEEYPGGQLFTAGWQQGYDVYLHARQHGQMHDWKNGNQALVVSEYGDWEYYADNEGFDQKTGAGLLPEQLNSRVFRTDGPERLWQQLRNHVEALNDTLSSPAALDGQWSMFDYPRGYHPVRASCGVMDFFRLPKWSYYFYRSQRSPQSLVNGQSLGPVVFIAAAQAPYRQGDEVWVLSNCDDLKLYGDDELIPAIGNEKHSGHESPLNWEALPHPPRCYVLPNSVAALKAVAVDAEGRKAVCEQTQSGQPAAIRLDLEVLDAPRGFSADAVRLCWLRAVLVDAAGNTCGSNGSQIEFTVSEPMAIIDGKTFQTEWGVASALIRTVSDEEVDVGNDVDFYPEHIRAGARCETLKLETAETFSLTLKNSLKDSDRIVF